MNRLKILKAISVYRKCMKNGKFNLAVKIMEKYDLGNPIHTLRNK